jgi:uncharacterized membrane protein
MIDGWLYALTLATALACGLVAGAFYAFSSFVMKALARIPAPQGIAAMQSINVEAPTAGFMAGFMGAAAGCAALVVIAPFRWDEPYAVYLLVGGLLYLVGTILLTMGYHVPRNNELAVVEPTTADAERRWTHYITHWTGWNHVRALAALAAAGVLTVAVHVT